MKATRKVLPHVLSLFKMVLKFFFWSFTLMYKSGSVHRIGKNINIRTTGLDYFY
jgi:hypothetical protein